MTTADHIPSRNCYLRGCREDGCVNENYRYAKQLKLEHIRGEHRRLDVAEVRAHIQLLLDNNWWMAEIARASGVPRSNLQKIMSVSRTTHRDTARAILAVPVVQILRTPLGERVHALGSCRRLRALAWLGHPWLDVGQHTGVTTDRLGVIANARIDVIRPDEARAIAAAYRELSIKPGRMKQIATYARNKGWDGPLAWDDIDDPDSRPETGAVAIGGINRRPRVVADPDQVARLTRQGMSAAQIAQWIGCNKRTVVRIRGRVASKLEVAA